MNALPASSSPELISPLASKLVQFLAQKQAMGYRYKTRAARCASWIAFSTLAYRQKTRYHAGHCARLRSATGY